MYVSQYGVTRKIISDDKDSPKNDYQALYTKYA